MTENQRAASKLRAKIQKNVKKNDIQEVRQNIYDMYEADNAPLSEKSPLSWTPLVEAAAIASVLHKDAAIKDELMQDLRYTKDAFSINEEDYMKIKTALEYAEKNDIDIDNLESHLCQSLHDTQLTKIIIR